MPASAAQIQANRQNGLKGRGPVTAEGKATSRRNSYKHGLAGEGVVVPPGEAEEIRARVEALAADIRPRSPAGSILVERLATLSVRCERAARQEVAAIAHRVRHAADDYDEARIEAAAARLRALADDPRGHLRGLRKTPEGVDLLVDAWRDLRADLAAGPAPTWGLDQLERAANLAGLPARHARGSELGALSRAFWGEPPAPGDRIGDDNGGGLDEAGRRAWARSRLFERIDGAIAELEAHVETLDFETIAIDRAEAGQRALFDDSKPACLARRYESEANRGFFKALQELRAVEAESEARAEVAPPGLDPANEVPAGPELGSFREIARPADRASARTFPDAPPADFAVARGPGGQPVGPGRPPR